MAASSRTRPGRTQAGSSGRPRATRARRPAGTAGSAGGGPGGGARSSTTGSGSVAMDMAPPSGLHLRIRSAARRRCLGPASRPRTVLEPLRPLPASVERRRRRGGQHGTMSDIATGTSLEIVVLAAGPPADLDAGVRRLHARLTSMLPPGWRLTIATQGATEAATAEAARLASQLDATRAVALPGRLDRKARRARWAASAADVVAFVELDATSDLDGLLAPLTRAAVVRAPLPAAADERPSAGPLDRLMPRRRALLAVGGLGMTALLAACGSCRARAPGRRPPRPLAARRARHRRRPTRRQPTRR